MKQRLPAEAFPVGGFIREEMEERGWSIEEMSQRAVLPVAEIKGLIDGTLPMLARRAERIGIAFGTGAAVWMNLSIAYKRWMKERAA